MNEAQFKGKLVKKLRSALPSLVIFRHEDMFTAGIPDLSVTRPGFPNPATLWLEAKITPSYKISGIQDRTLWRLGGYYILYNNKSSDYTVALPRTGEVIFEGTFLGLLGFVTRTLAL